MAYRVAMDIGGTFTDVVTYDDTARTPRAGKVLTTPDDLARGVFAALERFQLPFDEISLFVHGTTQDRGERWTDYSRHRPEPPHVHRGPGGGGPLSTSGSFSVW